MMPILIALIASLVLVLTALSFQSYRRLERRRALAGLELTPNCLLTRHPIVFLSGHRSLFRPFDHWNDIPFYLREHGYDVWEIEAHPDEPETLIKALNELPMEKCHVIADTPSLKSLELIARAKHPKITSLTCVRNGNKNTNATRTRKDRSAPTPEDLKPLDKAIEYFELTPPQTSRAKGWRTTLASFCLLVHNHIFMDRSRRVDPIETAEYETSFAIASRFLELAISLAERDFATGRE